MLTDLRLKAESFGRAQDWDSLLALECALRDDDPEWWPHFWAPWLVIGAFQLGTAWQPLLDEAIERGFRQPEFFELDALLGNDPSWPHYQSALRQPPPPAPHVLVEWPTVTYGPPLGLDTIDAQSATQFAKLLPTPSGDAWSTALMALKWATTRWSHANAHVESENALEVVQRAAAGERFACVEYSVLLGQTLNALGIPARRVALRTHDFHVGVARGHVVTEAWIDGLNAWVLLDGQNGCFWGTTDSPLGLQDLCAAYSRGESPPPAVTLAKSMSEADRQGWWRYFAFAQVGGMVCTSTPTPWFQSRAAEARLVVAPDAVMHPDLSELSTAFAVIDDEPGIAFTPQHPYATGVVVKGHRVEVGQAITLNELPTGECIEVCAETRYGLTKPHALRIQHHLTAQEGHS